MSNQQAKKRRFAVMQRKKRSNRKAWQHFYAEHANGCLACEGEGQCIPCFWNWIAKVMSVTMQVPVELLNPVPPVCGEALPVVQKSDARWYVDVVSGRVPEDARDRLIVDYQMGLK